MTRYLRDDLPKTANLDAELAGAPRHKLETAAEREDSSTEYKHTNCNARKDRRGGDVAEHSLRSYRSIIPS